MKKLFTTAVLLMLALLALTGCIEKNKAGTLKNSYTLDDVMAAADAAFAERYGADYKAVAMSMAVDSHYLEDFCAIEPGWIKESAGSASMSMTNSDALFVVRAQHDHVEDVRGALERRREDLIDQYRQYPVNGSFDRAEAGEVYVKGDYVFLIVVGVTGSDSRPADFAGDVQMVKDVIDGMFNA